MAEPFPSGFARRCAVHPRRRFARTGCLRAAAQPLCQGCQPLLALPVIGVDYAFARNLKRQASVLDDVSRQDAQVVTTPFKITGELADSYRANDVGRRK